MKRLKDSQSSANPTISQDKNGVNSSISKNGGESVKFSLKKSEEVIPNGNWQAGATFNDVKSKHPTLFELNADESAKRNPTQITGTKTTYAKIYDILKSEDFNGTILDASSGLGYGTQVGREMGFKVDDVEPFPDKSYKPKYTDYTKIDKKYDVIISNAVLNVLPQDLRNDMVYTMSTLLKDNGKMFINVRGDDVKKNKSNIPINPKIMEYFVSNTGSYQKGFTVNELVSYLQDVLGDEYKVASAYGKDTNPQGLINKSEILYINPNKNKTHNWLSINRLQLPLHITNYGFLNTIKPQKSESVNSSISENGGESDSNENTKPSFDSEIVISRTLKDGTQLVKYNKKISSILSEFFQGNRYYDFDNPERNFYDIEKWKQDLKKYQVGIANETNFYTATLANFTEIKKPDRKPDFVSNSSSMYWYTKDGVVRGSDHWNDSVATCSWFLEGNDQYVYDITLKENKKIASQAVDTGATLSQGKAINPTISQDKNGVNSSISKNDKKSAKLSLKDSQGKTLTKEQAEFFKDSKVRDEDGNLLVVYHGSPNDFTVFDDSKYGENMGGRGFYGRGFYFATSKATATFTNERINNILDYYASKSNSKYSQAYLAYIGTEDFLRLTSLKPENWLNALRKGDKNLKLDREELKNNEQTPYLVIDYKAHDVTGHEGRHRMVAMLGEGIKKSPVVIISYSNKYDKTIEHDYQLTGQSFYSSEIDDDIKIDYSVNLDEMIPANYENENLLNRKFADKGEIRFSLKDSQGKTLTKEQAEFFKDSKVRDEDGNLLVVYHGSPNDFTVFDDSKYGENMGGRGFYGRGFYFATSKATATNYGGNITSAYLNAKKLLDVDKSDWTYLLGIEERPKKIEVDEVFVEEMKKGFFTIHYNIKDEPDNWRAFNSVSKMQLEDDKSGKSFVQHRLNPDSRILPRDIYNLAEIARGKGYDGIIGDATNVGDTGKEIVVFSPNQIKSVDNLKPTSDDDIRYSLKHTFANEMKKAIEQKNNYQESHIEVGNIPSFYSRFGFDISKPMTITAKHIRDITTPKNVNHSEYHGLAQSQVLDAIKSLNQPVTVLSSHKEDGTVVIVTNVIDNDNIPISIYIHPNGTAYINNKEIKSTHIRSIYGRDNVTNYFNRAVGDGRVLYFDKKRSQELNKIPGVYFPNNLKNLDFNNNVSRYRDIVNNYYMQNDKNHSLKHKDITNDETKLILKENEELKESVEILKGEFKLTKGHKVKRSSVFIAT